MLVFALAALAATDPRGLPPAWTAPIPADRVQIADVDADGRADLIAPHGLLTALVLDAAAGGEVDLTLGADDAAPGSWGDINGDGAADQLTWTGDATAGERALRARLGGALDTVVPVTVDDAIVPWRFGSKVPIGPLIDLDGDGRAEALMRAYYEGEQAGEQHLAVHRGTASGLASASVWRSAIGGESLIDAALTVVGDVDADGFRELLWIQIDDILGETLPALVLTRGDEDGFRDAWWASIGLPATTTALDGFQVTDVGDLTGDGFADVLIVAEPDDETLPTEVLLFDGDPNYGFGLNAPEVIWSGVTDALVILGVGDVDGDTLTDLVYGLPGEGRVVLQRDALGWVTDFDPIDFTSDAPGFGRAGAVADVDADGRADLVIADDAGLTLFLGFTDGDLDGYDDRGEDCGPLQADVHPGADEVWYDGIDQDCDGNDDDQDGDGVAHPADCADADPDVHPGVAEVWYDGIDQDCDGNDDDQDGDGVAHPDDCDDADPSTFPGADEVDDDGVDQDCDGEDATFLVEPAMCGCQTTGTPTAWAWAAAALLWRRRSAR